ncbi:MAG: hypothetical protein BWY73_01181 [candidate division TA06 bacterium ADurb.Bin417]|uniref:CARDB domain-containing protein n=1 Tax=candidate division TA06 bacterium ADurb.Bin417 TaxID=1852828 RepID=A0A1V5MCW8_UNCT6|nr:MAG: hypothetical protein BWY73_01181 [candidate division TA06 bacterium ADurb.Bin417]
MAEGGAEVSYAALQTAAFPYPEADLAAADSQLYAVWLTDDPARASLNRTKLVFSKYDGSAWSAPQAVCDDGTADFHPSLVMFSDGWAAVAWENGDRVLPDTAGFEEVKQNLEICAALYDPAAGAWLPPHRFTTNNYLDRNPKISGFDRNHLLVLWTANPNNHVTGNAANPNSMYASYLSERSGYDTNWAPPQMFWSVGYPVLKYDALYMPRQESGMINGLMASLDMDGDTSTTADREIWRVHHYDNQFGFYWDSPNRRTYDSVPDENPQFYIGPEGLSYYMWLKDNQIVKIRAWYGDLYGAVHTFDEYNSNLTGFRVVKSPGGRVAVGWAEASEYGSDLWTIFYDPATAAWGEPQQLTHDSAVEKFPVFAFFGDDRLVSLYDRKEMSQLQAARTTPGGRAALAYTPSYGPTGLYALTYAVRTDIALLPGSLTIDPENPAPGQECLLSVTAVNNGNTAANNVPVAFYQGDPAAGGILIGQVVITGLMRPGDSQTVTLLWTVPAEVTGTVTIYALLDPAAAVAGDDTSNNRLELARVKPDLRAAWLASRSLTAGLLSLTGRVENPGVTAAGPFQVQIRKDRPDGELLYQQDFDGLAAKAIGEFNYRWESGGVAADWLYLLVDTGGAVDELNEGNNTYILKLNAYQKGDVNRDWKVNIADAIRAEAMFLGIYAPDPGLADMNGDGLVDLVDVKLLLERCASWLETQ